MTTALLLALAIAALYLAVRAWRGRCAMPRGVLVYSDADGRGRPLRSPLRPLSGKPDYVIRDRRGDHVPVEIKSYRSGARPPHGDIVQLGAYLLLLEDLHGRRPRHGVLRYPDRVLRVAYTEALRTEVIRLLAHVQRAGQALPPGTPHPALCRTCPFAPRCDAARA